MKIKPPNKITWQQFENIRVGDCNMLDPSKIFRIAIKKKYMELARIIQEKRYIEMISGYSQALKDNKFVRRS